MKKVFVTDRSWPSYDKFVRQVETAGGTVCFASAADEAALVREGSDADIVVNSFAKVTSAYIASLTHCETIIRTGISVDTIDVPAATARGIKVCCVPDYCRDEVADHTVTLAVAALRRIAFLDKRMRRGVWNSVEAGGVPRLSNAVFGLIGFGAIARRVAARAQSFGMRVIACDPYLEDGVFAEHGVLRAADRDGVLREADVVSLHLPLDPSTYHTIDGEAFARMKDGAVFVNTARGGLVDTDALIAALRSGKLSAASLDVFETEPLDPESALFQMDQVLLTPHAAYYSRDSLPELEDKSTDEVLRTLRGEQNRVIVNKRALGL